MSPGRKNKSQAFIRTFCVAKWPLRPASASNTTIWYRTMQMMHISRSSNIKWCLRAAVISPPLRNITTPQQSNSTRMEVVSMKSHFYNSNKTTTVIKSTEMQPLPSKIMILRTTRMSPWWPTLATLSMSSRRPASKKTWTRPLGQLRWSLAQLQNRTHPR